MISVEVAYALAHKQKIVQLQVEESVKELNLRQQKVEKLEE